MDTIHAAEPRSPGEPEASGAGGDVRTALAALSRRERALTKLLETPGADTNSHRNAVQALVIAYEPRLAGIAILRDGVSDLSVETAWHDGEFIAPFSWSPDAGIMCDMAGADAGCWHARLDPIQLPGTHLLADLDQADFHCETLRGGGDVAGYLFRVGAALGEAGPSAPNDLCHMVATKLSAELDLEAERRARRISEQQFEDVATTAFDWFWAMDTDYRFTYISERWREITGLDPSDFIGKTLQELGANARSKRWARFFNALDERAPISSLGTRTVGADGEDRYWTINGKPWFDEDGAFKGYRGTGTDISAEIHERWRAETAERLLREAIDAIPQGFIAWDENDGLVICNQQYRDLYPEIADILVEGATFTGLARRWAEVTKDRPDDLSVDELFERRMESHRASDGDFEFTRRDGSCFLISEKKTGAGASVSVHADITPLKRRELELQRLGDRLASRNAYFDAALNTMTQGLVTFDSDGRLIVCNRRYQEIFALPDGLTAEGTPTQKILDHIASQGLIEDIHAKVAKARAQARAEGWTTTKRRFSDGRTFEVQCNLLDNGDLLIALHDVTAFEQHAKQLNEYAERLEFSNRELQEFAYVASHDLQEPLRKIEAFGDRLRTKYADRLDDNGLVYLDRMQDASSRMRSLIRELLNYSRLTTKAKPFEATDLNIVVDGVLNDLEVGIESTGGEVRRGGLPTVEAEPTQIRQLFQNLISNALKFRKPDVAPVVEISATAVGAGDAARWSISVADNGIGFEQKYADQIFKIFQRLHGRSEYEGTGIGLATCRKIIDLHSGAIEASSEPGVGTTVAFVLPVKQQQSEESNND
ncbi:MAG: PAS-domain containing protein [Hyphomicrobiales bacterium]